MLLGRAEEASLWSDNLFFTLRQLVYQNVTVLLNGLLDLGSGDVSGTPGAVGDEESGAASTSKKSSASGGSEQTRQNHGSFPLPILRYSPSDI